MSSDFIETRLIEEIRNKAILILPKQAFLPQVQNEGAVGDFVNNLLAEFSPYIDSIESYLKIKDIVVIHLSETVLDQPNIISDIAMTLRPILRPYVINAKEGHYLQVGLVHKDFKLGSPENLTMENQDYWRSRWCLPNVHSVYEYKD